MKKLVFSAFLALVGFAASAQNVCKGTVVDKDGNPVAQAKVEVVGAETSCLTDLDGTFSIEVPATSDMLKVVYLGMSTKTVKAKPEMTVTMRKASQWSGVYDSYQPMFSIQGLIPSSFEYDAPAMGISFGQVKELGWYTKALWTMNNTKCNYAAAIVGGMFRLGCPIYLYLGAGISAREVIGAETDGNYYRDTREPFNAHGCAVDAGLMFRMENFFLNAGTIVNFSDHFNGNISPLSFSIGVGCCL